MDRRNLGSMDGMDCWHPCNLDSGDPCRNDGCFNNIGGVAALNSHANWFAPPTMKAVGYAVRTFKGLQWYAQRTLLGYRTFMATPG